MIVADAPSLPTAAVDAMSLKAFALLGLLAASLIVGCSSEPQGTTIAPPPAGANATAGGKGGTAGSADFVP